MTSPASHADSEQRVLIFAPIGRDADLTRELLDHAAVPCAICRSLRELTDQLTGGGAAALLLTEEALDELDLSALVTILDEQPPWSDIPLLLFAGGPEAANLLYERMRALGISKAEVNEAAQGVMWDLERTCACCNKEGACAKDLAKNSDDPVWKS